MNKLALSAFLLLIATPFLTAQQAQNPQPPFGIYGLNVEERASTRIGYWRQDVNAGLGEVVLSYGRPPWKPQYKDQLDQLTRGKMWRMGDNYWSLLDTNLPVQIGGVDVAVGLYYLAIYRSQDGQQWELVFIDPVKSRKEALDSYDVGTRPDKIPILFKAPLQFSNTGSTTEKLTVVFSMDSGQQTRGALKLSWGDFQLTAPVVVKLP